MKFNKISIQKICIRLLFGTEYSYEHARYYMCIVHEYVPINTTHPQETTA